MHAHIVPVAPACPGRRRTAAVVVGAGLLLLAAAHGCRAGIDHQLPYDDSGIWKRNYQEFVEYGLIAAEIGGALWEGGERGSAARSGRRSTLRLQPGSWHRC